MNNAIYLMPFGSQLSAAEYAARAKAVLMEMRVILEPDDMASSIMGSDRLNHFNGSQTTMNTGLSLAKSFQGRISP